MILEELKDTDILWTGMEGFSGTKKPMIGRTEAGHMVIAGFSTRKGSWAFNVGSDTLMVMVVMKTGREISGGRICWGKIFETPVECIAAATSLPAVLDEQSLIDRGYQPMLQMFPPTWAIGCSHLRRMHGEDFSGYAGAEECSDGSGPFIGEIEIGDSRHDLIVAGGKGVTSLSIMGDPLEHGFHEICLLMEGLNTPLAKRLAEGLISRKTTREELVEMGFRTMA